MLRFFTLLRNSFLYWLRKDGQGDKRVAEGVEDTGFDWVEFEALLRAQLGKLYRFGAEVRMDDPDPKEWDCSELVEWIFAQFGIKVPDGSWKQYEASYPITKEEARLGDLAFFKRKGADRTHHVGIVLDGENMIEARGEPYMRVILRPRKIWEKWQDFAGYRRLVCMRDKGE